MLFPFPLSQYGQNTTSISVHRAAALLSLRTVFCSPCHFSSLGPTRNSSALPAVSFAILGQRMFEVLCFPAQCTAQPCWPRCRAAQAATSSTPAGHSTARHSTARHGTAHHATWAEMQEDFSFHFCCCRSPREG